MKKFRNVSGTLLTAPDGGDWASGEDRDLEDGQEVSLLVYGKIAEIRTEAQTPVAPARAQVAQPPAVTDTTQGGDNK
jgi:hypothetical protein